MSDAAQNQPHATREDANFEALEAFIRTSAGYLGVDEPLPGQRGARQSHERATHAGCLR
jgi:hypothetical protein